MLFYRLVVSLEVHVFLVRITLAYRLWLCARRYVFVVPCGTDLKHIVHWSKLCHNIDLATLSTSYYVLTSHSMCTLIAYAFFCDHSNITEIEMGVR